MRATDGNAILFTGRTTSASKGVLLSHANLCLNAFNEVLDTRMTEREIRLLGTVRVLMKGLDYERIVDASASIGLMQAALDIVLPYVRERKQFGQAMAISNSFRTSLPT